MAQKKYKDVLNDLCLTTSYSIEEIQKIKRYSTSQNNESLRLDIVKNRLIAAKRMLNIIVEDISNDRAETIVTI